MTDQRRPRREDPEEFYRTLWKVLLSLVLGFAALIALGATVCGFILGFAGPSGGPRIAFVGVVALGLLIYAIIWVWR